MRQCPASWGSTVIALYPLPVAKPQVNFVDNLPCNLPSKLLCNLRLPAPSCLAPRAKPKSTLVHNPVKQPALLVPCPASSGLPPQAKPKVKLVNNLPRNLPPVLGDTGRIIQILHNIVGNSCKFTHTGEW